MKPSQKESGFFQSFKYNNMIEWIGCEATNFCEFDTHEFLYACGNWLTKIIYLLVFTLGKRVEWWSCKLKQYYCLNALHGVKPLSIRTNLN